MHLTQFSPIGARLRAAERARTRRIMRELAKIVICAAIGALMVVAFL